MTQQARLEAMSSKAGGISEMPLPPDSLLQKRINELVFVALDTEATGRHPMVSSLLEVAAIKFRSNGEIIDVRSQLLNPGSPIPAEVSEVHGITDDMVASEPSAAEVLPAFVEWMTGYGRDSTTECPHILLAHNAPFDINFLQVALTKLGKSLPTNPVLDTLKLAPHYIRETKNHRLKTLIENLPAGADAQFHRAEADARHVISVFLEIIKRAGENCSLADLVKAGGVNFFSKPYELVEDLNSARDERVHRIGEAIHNGRDLHIHYRGHGPKFRQITPLSVLYFGKRFFLRAYCHATKNERTFRINRISNIDMAERKNAES